MLGLTIRGILFSSSPFLLVFSSIQASQIDPPIQNLAVPLPFVSQNLLPTCPLDDRDQQAIAINLPDKQPQLQQQREEKETMSSSSGHPTLAETISNQLTKYHLRQWGFVIVRTTYSSEAKWAEFLAIINDSIRFWCFHPLYEAHSYLYDKHVMTVLQNAATLSDANLSLTARVFTDWINSPEARAEREGTKINDSSIYSSRYHFYIHADESTVEQVLAQHAKRQAVPKEMSFLRSSYLYEDKDRFTVRVVSARQVMLRQEGIIQEYGPDANTDLIEEDEEEDELLDLIKRVRIFQIPELYAVLGDNLDRWFDIYTKDGGVCEV